MEPASVRLKKIRLEKGLSLEEIQKKTKIHLNILKAIEEDNLVDLDPVYIRGFLKIYCKSLGVDPRDYIAEYKEPQKEVTIRRLPRRMQDSGSFFKAVSVKLFSLNERIKIPLRLRKAPLYLGILIAMAALFYIGKAASSRRQVKRQGKIPPSLLLSQAQVKEKVRVSSSPGPARPRVAQASTPRENIPKEAASGGIRLTIRAQEDCWIKLNSDGKLFYNGVLKKGRADSWKAKDKIELSLGNAGVVALEVNGKLISNLGRRGQAVKNITISKEGLAVAR